MKTAILMVSLAMPLVAAEVNSVQPGGFAVHEWGTLTSVAGGDGSVIEWDTLGCKSDLPQFVNDFGYRGLKLGVRGSVRMETPVLYFYSPRPLEARVKVGFPRGLLTEWYPQAEYEVHQKAPTDGREIQLAPRNVAGCTKCHTNLNGIDTSLQNLTGVLEWKKIRVEPGANPGLPVESAPSRYYAARGTDSAPIAVGDQHEKFLFYRGVGSFPIPLATRVSEDGKVTVENRGGETISRVILFENREGRIGYRNAGAVADTITLNAPPLNASFAELRGELETALIAQGLFPKEAHAMIETWRDSWFEEGSRLIYILSSSSVDTILPLQVEPTPSQIARVFVGRIELITPDTMRSVESAIARSDWAKVERYHRFLAPVLKLIYIGDAAKANEISRRLWDYEQSSSSGNCR
jgi:hypothetical protein